MTIRKISDEKKVILVQLEESNQKCSDLEVKLSDTQKKIEDTEKSMSAFKEETNVKLQESTNNILGKSFDSHRIFFFTLV